MIFITGCNGLVGSFIARRLLQDGQAIRALKRQHSDLRYLEDIKNHIEWIEGDILDTSLLNEAMQGCDKVVHSAAIVSFDAKTKDNMYKVNVEGTTNIVNLCLDLGVEKLTFISSVAALGRKKNSEVIDETNQWEASKFNTHYAQTKHLSEMEVWRGHAEGLQTVIVNPSLVLGPSPWNRSSTQLFKYVWDQRKFYATGSLNYIDVRDLAEIVFQLLASNINGDRFVVNAGNVLYKELFDKIASIFKRRAPHLKVTPMIAAIAWRLAFLQSVITRKPPFITRETAYMSQKHFYYKSDKLKEKLNFEFRTLDESIQWTCQELIKFNKLK